MKKTALLLAFLLLLSACVSCGPTGETEEEHDYDYYAINMNTDFPVQDTLPDGEGKPAKVILLLGQSNASGCSINAYLEKAVPAEQYAAYAAGYDNVRINYCIDNHNRSSGGAFVPVDLSCGAGDGFFGPEVGMAEVLSAAFSNETVFILKFTMSGYSLNHHWLYGFERASIYQAFLPFVSTYMEYLLEKGYAATIDAMCWMQGESDTDEWKSGRYLQNLTAFVDFLREDLAPFTRAGGFYFIDAGISDGPYCLPGYPAVNAAKEQFAATSPLHVYFSTIDEGLTTLQEPTEAPDYGHYDALSELRLGRMFGERIVKIYS